jgi:hypothetical protein
MSSAIIFINRVGVAVAADSAVTIGEREAIFNSAQKIFPIGKPDQSQVLVITFANAAFMGIPIELILKKYSKHIIEHSFSKNTIEDYMNDFIRYVEEEKDNFNFKDNEWSYLYWLFVSIFDETFSRLRNARNDDPEKDAKLFLEELFTTLFNEQQDEIDKHAKWDESNQIKNMVGKDFIHQKYPKLIEEAFRDRLAKAYTEKNGQFVDPEKMELDEEDTLFLKYFVDLVHLMLRNRNVYRNHSRSGIYFVGYGDKSLYPSYWGVDAYAFLNGKFIYENDWRRDVTLNNRAYYKPLAQDDSIEAFIIGVNWQRRSEMFNLVKETVNEAFVTLQKEETLKDEALETIQKNVMESVHKIDYFNELDEQGQKSFTSSLAVMGVMDMAEYAENLISLQSLKRKYDLDNSYNSTVGGPTDVAIITKFDGFKWIKFKGK